MSGRALIAVVIAGALAGAGAFTAERSFSGARVRIEADPSAEGSARTAEVCSCCAPRR